MTNSLMRWHLSRDNQSQLARFCQKHKTRSNTKNNTYNDGEHSYFEITFTFDNGGFITAELLQGDERGYTVADHFQVIDYDLGAM